MQEAKAAAVLVASQAGHDVVQMTCESLAECSLPLMTPATMISHDDALQLKVGLPFDEGKTYRAKRKLLISPVKVQLKVHSSHGWICILENGNFCLSSLLEAIMKVFQLDNSNVASGEMIFAHSPEALAVGLWAVHACSSVIMHSLWIPC